LDRAIDRRESDREGVAMRLSSAAFCTLLALGSQVHSQTLDDQARCAAQARTAFDEWKVDPWGGRLLTSGNEMLFDYHSHYNTKRRKCFVLLQVTASSLGHTTLMDAFERRVYADYLSYQGKGGETKTCILTPTLRDRDTKTCDGDEFEAFVAGYMDEEAK
jgi:hypothetical protein